MESTEELQQQEITALKSIYGDDFQEAPAPRAWKVCRPFTATFSSTHTNRARIGCFKAPRVHDQDYAPKRCQWNQVLSFPNGHVSITTRDAYTVNADPVSVFPRRTLPRLLQSLPLRTPMGCYWTRSTRSRALCNRRRRKFMGQKWYSRSVHRLVLHSVFDPI